MKRGKVAWLIAVLLAAGFAYGALRLFGIQFAVGEVYPPYSSLRSDPRGAKLLFDSLKSMPGIRAERNFLPPEYLPDHGATILFLGMAVGSLVENLKVLEREASRGNRIAIALQIDSVSSFGDSKALQDSWHVKLDPDTAKGRTHRFSLGAPEEWRVLDRVGPKVLAIEKGFGKGTVALFVESSDFTNESTVAGDRLPQVSAAIGPFSHIVFDEQHLGIAEGGSIMDLARRFRLTGLMAGMALVAALFLWRNAAGFPPQAPATMETRLSGRTSQAGLLTLLRRHVPPRELPAACWQEWLNGNRGQVSAARMERAAEIARTGADRPLEAAREIAAVLHGKGAL
jgi:hypothetical protein